MSRDLRELLDRTAPAPTRTLPVDAVITAGRRRRRRRQAGIAASSIAAAVLVVLAVPRLTEGPAAPEVVDRPPAGTPVVPSPSPSAAPTTGTGPGTASPSAPPVVTPTPGAATGAALDLGPELVLEPDGRISGLVGDADHGFAVAGDGVVAVVAADGTAVGHLPGTAGFAVPLLPGWSSSAHLPVVEVDGSGPVWLDLAERRWLAALNMAPLGGGAWVIHDVDRDPAVRMRLYRATPAGTSPTDDDLIAAWPEGAPWWVTPDHRVVTWSPCLDGACETRYHDLDVGGDGTLEPGCWVANASGDFALTVVCGDGTEVVSSSPGGSRTTPIQPADDGTAVRVTAAFDGGVLRFGEVPVCGRPALALLDGEGDVLPVAGASAATTAIPVGTAPPLEVLVHVPTGCEPEAHPPGLYRVDLTEAAWERLVAAAWPAGTVVGWQDSGLQLVP